VTGEVLVDVADLRVHFPLRRTGFAPPARLHAVDGVSFQVRRGTTFGIVGQSGSGKSTLALALMRLVAITGGQVTIAGMQVTELRGRALRHARRAFQMVFQDPYASLDPRRRAGALVREPLDRLHLHDRAGRERVVAGLFDAVGLPAEAMRLFPHQFSGGQRQRLCIARALASAPALVVCDEPVSALDVAIQAQILNLLHRLQRERGLTYVFISHDLGVVQHLCDEVAVMYMGRIVEQAPARTLFATPRHPYTWSLIEAAAFGTSKLSRGEPPSPIAPPPGCRFAAQCPHVQPRCRAETPALLAVGPGHLVACLRVGELVGP
jgi:peptide/nickel transport system ATP-binding protein